MVLKSAKPIICETFSLKLWLITCRNWPDRTKFHSEQMGLHLMSGEMPRTSQSLGSLWKYYYWNMKLLSIDVPAALKNNFLLHNVYINIDINFLLQENLKLYILYRLSFYSGRRSQIAISCSEMYLSDDDLWDWPQFRMQEESLSSTSACSSSLCSQHDNETRANLDAMYFLCKSLTPPSCWFIINTRLAEIELD